MIQVSIHQELKPEPISQDSRGTTIEVGHRVAFNKSGNVVLGRIESIDRNEWKVTRPGVSPKQWWNIKFEMTISDEKGNLSKIKNPNSFVIV